MRSAAFAVSLLAALTSGEALAGMRVSEKVETYAIHGASGKELVADMDRRGPRQGLLTRAIAQTRYSVEWDVAFATAGRACRVARANAVLSIVYIYPKPAQRLPAAVERRWRIFLAGAQKHERNHGRLAREMVTVAQKSLAGISAPNDPRCNKVRSEVKRRVDATVAAYEKKQIRFDAVEHAEGGNVDRLILALMR